MVIGNRGVLALLHGALKVILHNIPDAEVFLLDYAKKRQSFEFHFNNRDHKIDTINLRFSRKIYLRNNVLPVLIGALLIRLFPFKPVKYIIFRLLPRLEEIDRADLALSISGGDSFSDIYGTRPFLYSSLLQILVILLRKRLVLLPQTLGPFKTVLSRKMAKYIMLNSEKIYTRDMTSQDAMKKLYDNQTIAAKFRFNYDVAFVLEPGNPENPDVDALVRRKDPGKLLVGLNISGLLFRGGYTQNNQFGLKIDYPHFINALIRWWIDERRAQVLLVPHVFGTQLESDNIVCRQIYRELKQEYKDSISFLDYDFDQSEIKCVIGLCDFFMGSRMHACIAALSQHLPTVGLAYSRKFYGLFETIGLEDLVADMRTLDEKQIYDKVRMVLDDRERIVDTLKRKIPEVQKSILGILGDEAADNASTT